MRVELVLDRELDLDFEGKKGNYLRNSMTLAELKVIQIDLYKLLMQNIEKHVLKGEPKDPNMQCHLI